MKKSIDKKLLIVGLNDSQLINVNFAFLGKNLIDYLALKLNKDGYSTSVINAGSLMINKTEHVDYLLEQNLSVSEIKKIRLHSFVESISKFEDDFRLPKILSKVAKLYKFSLKEKDIDKDTHISTEIQNAENPIIIYSSGVNDLMRELGVNPFSILNDYKNKDKTPNYNYGLEKSKDEKTVDGVISRIDNNINNILSLNNSAKVCVFGAYLNKSEKEDSIREIAMQPFYNVIDSYNVKLKEVCDKYGVSFIRTDGIGEKNSTQENIHISKTGHVKLSNVVLSALEDYSEDRKKVSLRKFVVKNKGISGFISSVGEDAINALAKMSSKNIYEKKRANSIYGEHIREIKILEKTRKNYIKI